MKTLKHLAIVEAMTTLLLANEKNILLPALLVLWALEIACTDTCEF
ncbi:hypothetical protein ACKUCE_00135 [Flavobacterium psychrophilum]|nr:hypothetical protein [Flavobacterium psychrophilum]EKT3974881.1 hypothetical protein [Flavobacterium psychrophilum]EKT4525161.1 hypothetical protein [Flavobacterium psychrophilum]EKT4545506.1 hypothetical protein [Flavobacterium psychrophilum]MCB5980098.1 hypothetical protein [Flavobacterium psychrophilum]MCB5984015.1 hypothetical protein [Flavobacterium psychrophilum]